MEPGLSVPPWAATPTGAAAPLMGAVPVAGGWLVTAPGTPLGWAAPGEPSSTVCWLRTALVSGLWLGLCSSLVDSTREKSTSALTCAFTLLRPTSGSSMSMMRRV